MASSWFLNLAFKCLHHFAWPLLALLYPLCASVQAIETNSYEETKDLISYWILLSLIYLFEYAFMSLLLWFHLWQYMKLVIIIWLIVPDFGRASYVYNNLIRSMILQIVTFWRKCFVEKDNFLMHAERYMKENGTEALEKLIASKTNGERFQKEQKDIKDLEAIEEKEIPATKQNTMCRPDAEAANEIIATDNKEIPKTNGERLQTEHKDIKHLEAIEKKEIPATKQDIPVMPKISTSQSAPSATVETKGTAKSDTGGGEVPQKEVQKEWTCALCLVTTTSEKTLNCHLNGRRHKETIEALKAKKQPSPQKPKIYLSKEEVKQMNVSNKLNSNAKNGDSIGNKGLKGTVVMDHKVQKPKKNMSEPVIVHSPELMCRVCNVVLYCDSNVASHMQGKKHLAKMQAKLIV